MSDGAADPQTPMNGDAAAGGPSEGGEPLDGGARSVASGLPLAGAWGHAVRAGAGGEALSGRGVLAAIGGWRGVGETLLPGLLFLVTFTITRDARVSAIAPAILALIAIAVRLIRREPLASAFSGAVGVGIAVAATLLTGKGSDYYVPGFWTNGLWSAGLLISILVGWPLLGLAIGAFRGDLLGWRRERRLRRVGAGLTLLWLGLFLARLAVQLPLWFAAQGAGEGTAAGNAATDALGVARLVMGVPLFALVVVFTWMVLARVNAGDAGGESTPRGARSDARGDASSAAPQSSDE